MAKTQYRTQFFQDMGADGIDGETAAYLIAEGNVLDISTVGFSEECCNANFSDVENPYKNPALYRQMLREQAMIRARVRAGLI